MRELPTLEFGGAEREIDIDFYQPPPRFENLLLALHLLPFLSIEVMILKESI